MMSSLPLVRARPGLGIRGAEVRVSARSARPADSEPPLAFDRAAVARLDELVETTVAAIKPLSGRELRTMVTAKWGRPWALRVGLGEDAELGVVCLHVLDRCDDDGRGHDAAAAVLNKWRGAAACVRSAVKLHPRSGVAAVPVSISLAAVVRPTSRTS
jgi:hypothetical protein